MDLDRIQEGEFVIGVARGGFGPVWDDSDRNVVRKLSANLCLQSCLRGGSESLFGPSASRPAIEFIT